MRTSKFTIFIRTTVIVFIIYMMLAWAWNSMTNTNFWKPWEMGISAVLTVLLFGGFAWAFVRVGMGYDLRSKPTIRRLSSERRRSILRQLAVAS